MKPVPAEFLREEGGLFRKTDVSLCTRGGRVGGSLQPLILLLMVGVLLLGCGGAERRIESKTQYEPPTEHSVVVETVVDLPFEATWPELIRRLSESSFRVSTLEKASRFVRVDLNRSSDLAASANKPARYVDCGRTIRRFRDAGAGEKDEQRFEYEVAESSRYRDSVPVDGGYRVSDVERRVALDASATIFLQPEGSRRTRVTVKARYRVQIEIRGEVEFVPLDADEMLEEAQAFGPRVESVRFTTFQPGTDQRRGGLTCRSTGDFEHALIAMANPAAAI
jgi:hypothetical protein